MINDTSSSPWWLSGNCMWPQGMWHELSCRARCSLLKSWITLPEKMSEPTVAQHSAQISPKRKKRLGSSTPSFKQQLSRVDTRLLQLKFSHQLYWVQGVTLCRFLAGMFYSAISARIQYKPAVPVSMDLHKKFPCVYAQWSAAFFFFHSPVVQPQNPSAAVY